MTAQILVGEPWEAYIKAPAYGSSALEAFGMISLERWAYEYAGDGRYSGAASKFAAGGGALDALVTANKSFADCFAVKPEGMTFSTKEGKAWRDLQGSKEIIDTKQEREILSALPRVKEAISILADGRPVSYQVTLRGEIEGLEVQTRPDIWINGDLLDVTDLKYVSDIAGFVRGFVGSRYEIQAALAWELIEQTRRDMETVRLSYLLCESGTTLPQVIVYTLDPEDVRLMVRRLKARCRRILEAQNSPLGLIDVVKFEQLVLPHWARKKLEEEDA
jgi:hypothetical protein